MENSEKINWERIAAVLICIVGGILGFIIFCKYLLNIALPFICAGVVALIIVPPAAHLAEKTGTKKGLWAMILLFMLLISVILLTVLIVNRLYVELDSLVAGIKNDSESVDSFIDRLNGWISRASTHIPWLDGLRETEGMNRFLDSFDRSIESAIENTLSDIASGIPAFALSLISGLPSFLISVTVFMFASFYFCLQPTKMLSAIKKVLPKKLSDKISSVKNHAAQAVAKFIRAYLLIMMITFTELFIGFKIIGIEYALIIAAVTAVVDLLPVLGTGTVLIPWSVFSFLTGNFKTGTGLLIIYGVVVIIRQIIEPKLVGKSIGLHPLVTLAAMYAGLKLFSVTGMILFPLAAVLLKIWFVPEQTGEKIPPSNSDSGICKSKTS